MAEFDSLLSQDHVRLEVETEERVISRETTIQRAVSSLMGLLMAASGCPRTAFFRPMAQRLRSSSQSDSSVNAIILLDMYAKAMPYAIKQALDELTDFFPWGRS